MENDKIPVSARLNRHRNRTICLPRSNAAEYIDVATATETRHGYVAEVSAIKCREIWDKAMITMDGTTYDRMQRLLGFYSTDRYADHIASACALHVRVETAGREGYVLRKVRGERYEVWTDGIEVSIWDWESAKENLGGIAQSLWGLAADLSADGFTVRAV